MMKTKRTAFYLILCILFSVPVPGQGPDRTIDSLQQALTQKGISDTERVAILNELGYLYWVINSRESISYGEEALHLADSIGDVSGKAMAKRVLGVSYWTLGEPKQALEHLTEAEALYRGIGDKEGATNCLMNAGMVYADIQEYQKALELYNQSIQEFTELGLKGRIATTFTKIGSVYIEQGKLREAREYLTNALNMHREEGFVYGQGEAHNRLATLFLIEGELEQADHHLRRATAISERIEDRDGLISNRIQQGKLLRLRKEGTAAREQLTRAIEEAESKQLKKYTLAALHELKLLEKEEGNLEKALDYYDAYLALKDSIYNTNKSKQIAAIEFSNELSAKEKELLLLQEKERLNTYVKWGLIIGIIGLSVISMLIINNQRQRTARQKELLQRKQELTASRELLAKTALENARLQQKELQNQLDFKNRELTSYALNFVQKNELMQQLQERVHAVRNGSPTVQKKSLAELDRLIRKHISIDNEWEDFKRVFEEVHTDFHKKLKEKHPDLSANDLKICALTRLNMNIKEAASILNISPESVKTARYRLRKKLGLGPEEELLHYFIQLETA